MITEINYLKKLTHCVQTFSTCLMRQNVYGFLQMKIIMFLLIWVDILLIAWILDMDIVLEGQFTNCHFFIVFDDDSIYNMM